MILVAMPYYRCRPWVQRAVRSVLAQTVRDVRLLVIGDGEKPPELPEDPRLTVHVLSHNRGPYFALQLALLASPEPLFAPFGADDWAEQDHLERLLATGPNAKTGIIRVHIGDRDTEGFDHRGPFEVGLYERSRLLSFGGYNPAERLGQDSLLMKLLSLTGPVAVMGTPPPTYHRLKRPGSLTTDPATGHGSEARNATRARNRAIFHEAERLSGAAQIREYRERLVPSETRSALATEVLRLAPRLALEAAA